jgi:hypothetical protein
MTKLAHITARPTQELGDRVIGLCGKEFKITTLWADLPKDKPICRSCVDTALVALTEADALIESVRMRARRLSITIQVLDEILGKDSTIDTVVELDRAYQDELAMRAEQKAEKKRAKKTCTCTWTSQEIFEVDPDCPIHGGEDEPVREIEDVDLPEPGDASDPAIVMEPEEDQE